MGAFRRGSMIFRPQHISGALDLAQNLALLLFLSFEKPHARSV
jgi:hypothetical protein